MVGLFLVEMVGAPLPAFILLICSCSFSPPMLSAPEVQSTRFGSCYCKVSSATAGWYLAFVSLALLKNVTTLVLGRPAAKLDIARQPSF